MRDGAEIDIFKFAAHRHAARQPRHLHAAALEALRDDVRSRLALSREIGCQDDLLYFALRVGQGLAGAAFWHDAVKEFLQADLVGANAVERTELAHQHEVETAIGQRSFKRGLIGGGLDHAQHAAVTLRIGAGHAEVAFSQGIAELAVAHAADGEFKRARDLQRAGRVVLQQVKGHPCG